MREIFPLPRLQILTLFVCTFFWSSQPTVTATAHTVAKFHPIREAFSQLMGAPGGDRALRARGAAAVIPGVVRAVPARSVFGRRTFIRRLAAAPGTIQTRDFPNRTNLTVLPARCG